MAQSEWNRLLVETITVMRQAIRYADFFFPSKNDDVSCHIFEQTEIREKEPNNETNKQKKKKCWNLKRVFTCVILLYNIPGA